MSSGKEFHRNVATLSDQQLADSVTVDFACNGELTDSAFAFAEENATCTEASHSYTAKKGTRKVSDCTVNPREVSRGTKTCPLTAGKFGCRQWHSNT